MHLNYVVKGSASLVGEEEFRRLAKKKFFGVNWRQ